MWLSWLREAMPSLAKMLPRWYWTVRALMNSRVPISGFDSPSRASRAMWASWAVSSSSLPAKPFTVEEVSTGEFGARGGRAQMTDRLTVQPLGLVALAEQRAGACRDSQAPGGAGRQCELSKPSHGGSGPLGLAAADGCLDELGQREVREGQVVALFAGKLR